MDYEKKYKEASKWMESVYPSLTHEQQMDADTFFPELAESEDEKIRKEIISYVQQAIDSGYGIISKEREAIWLAWLEKQGEKKKEAGDGE